MPAAIPAAICKNGVVKNSLASTSKNTNVPSISDWDDDTMDQALTQLSFQQDFVDGKSGNKQIDCVVREMSMHPKRNFSPCFPRSGGTTDLDPNRNDAQKISVEDNSSKEEVDFLSQDDGTRYQKQIEKLEKQLMIKEGEINLLRDSKNDDAKKQVELKRGFDTREKNYEKQIAEILATNKSEVERLLSEKQFMEKEKSNLQRSLAQEKEARLKAESEKQQLLSACSAGIQLKNDENFEESVTTRNSSNKNGASAANTSSQFPTKNTFYSPSQIDENKNNIKRRKRNGTPSDSSGVNTAKRFSNDLRNNSSVMLPPVEKREVYSTFDESVQTEMPPKIVRQLAITSYLEEGNDLALKIGEGSQEFVKHMSRQIS